MNNKEEHSHYAAGFFVSEPSLIRFVWIVDSELFCWSLLAINFWRIETEFNPALNVLQIGTVCAFSRFVRKTQRAIGFLSCESH